MIETVVLFEELGKLLLIGLISILLLMPLVNPLLDVVVLKRVVHGASFIVIAAASVLA